MWVAHPKGRHLDGTLDFLRIAYGTLGDGTRGLSRRLIETFFCLPICNRMQAEGGESISRFYFRLLYLLGFLGFLLVFFERAAK